MKRGQIPLKTFASIRVFRGLLISAAGTAATTTIARKIRAQCFAIIAASRVTALTFLRLSSSIEERTESLP
jgi:hypothetical protein